jgi:hypothetical protein
MSQGLFAPRIGGSEAAMFSERRPIGMFDSGIGGLTVLKAILDRMPNENVVYFGDTARLPYGSKSSETVTRFSEEIVNFLLTKNPKMIVVACNTASAYSLPKIERMVAHMADIDFFVAASEQEALILELNLIKRHHPRYNVRLKDDKTFPYLKIDVNQEWPGVQITRRMQEDGARYFGPFASAGSVRQTLRVLQNIFPFRTCAKDITGTAPRACLEYHLGRC